MLPLRKSAPLIDHLEGDIAPTLQSALALQTTGLPLLHVLPRQRGGSRTRLVPALLVAAAVPPTASTRAAPASPTRSRFIQRGYAPAERTVKEKDVPSRSSRERD